MEMLLAGVGVWVLLGVAFGILLGRSACDADAAELVDVREPAAGDPPAQTDAHLQVG